MNPFTTLPFLPPKREDEISFEEFERRRAANPTGVGVPTIPGPTYARPTPMPPPPQRPPVVPTSMAGQGWHEPYADPHGGPESFSGELPSWAKGGGGPMMERPTQNPYLPQPDLTLPRRESNGLRSMKSAPDSIAAPATPAAPPPSFDAMPPTNEPEGQANRPFSLSPDAMREEQISQDKNKAVQDEKKRLSDINPADMLEEMSKGLNTFGRHIAGVTGKVNTLKSPSADLEGVSRHAAEKRDVVKPEIIDLLRTHGIEVPPGTTMTDLQAMIGPVTALEGRRVSGQIARRKEGIQAGQHEERMELRRQGVVNAREKEDRVGLQKAFDLERDKFVHPNQSSRVGKLDRWITDLNVSSELAERAEKNAVAGGTLLSNIARSVAKEVGNLNESEQRRALGKIGLEGMWQSVQEFMLGTRTKAKLEEVQEVLAGLQAIAQESKDKEEVLAENTFFHNQRARLLKEYPDELTARKGIRDRVGLPDHSDREWDFSRQDFREPTATPSAAPTGPAAAPPGVPSSPVGAAPSGLPPPKAGNAWFTDGTEFREGPAGTNLADLPPGWRKA